MQQALRGGITAEDARYYGAYIGPAWERYYRERFARLAAGGREVQWNWAAALVPFWAAYRRVHGAPLLYLLFPVLVVIVALLLREGLGVGPALLLAYGGVLASYSILQGAFGTTWLFVQARRTVQRLRYSAGDEAAALAWLARRAPRRSPRTDLAHGLASAIVCGVGLAVIVSFASGPPEGSDPFEPQERHDATLEAPPPART